MILREIAYLGVGRHDDYRAGIEGKERIVWITMREVVCWENGMKQSWRILKIWKVEGEKVEWRGRSGH